MTVVPMHGCLPLKQFFRAISVCCLLAHCAACAVTRPQEINEKYRGVLEDRRDHYELKVGDEVTIAIYQSRAEELSPQKFIVQPDGRADIYFMPNYRFAGKTITQIEQDVIKSYRDETGTDTPELSISCLPSAESIVLNGEFDRPGKLDFRPGMTLGDAVAEVGRLRITADSDYALLRRSFYPNPPGSPERFRIDLNDESEELFLLPGDEIYLQTNALATALLYIREYVFGVFPSSLYSFALGSLI